ncbi:MAG: T9SS type A sorting domain-containing protein, partial [Bacteroidales bacterium]|nr:T9SS type A sorting domain-containing protein [Bacteroidales bacterium]
YNSQNKLTQEDWYFTENQSYFNWKHEKSIIKMYDLQGNLVRYSNAWEQKKWTYKNNLQESECNLMTFDTIGAPIKAIDSTYFTYDRTGRNNCDYYYVNDSLQVMQLQSKTYYYHSLHNIQTPVQINTTAIEEQNKLSGVLIYPNPATDKIYISTNEFDSKAITLLSVSGHELLRYRLNPGEQEISLNDIAPGLYFIKITIKNETSIYKITIK